MSKELYQISVKITFETVSDNKMLNIFKNYIFDRFKKETSMSEYFYYFTFLDEGYRQQIIHLMVTNRDVGCFISSFPNEKKEIKKAIRFLNKINNHLVLRKEATGLHNDDFLMERISIKFEYLKK